MRLIIAEKPSLARAIADALPGSAKRGDGMISVGDTAVSWCLGHLLEQAAPDAYDPAYKQWRLDHLPIVPDSWKLMPRNVPSRVIRAMSCSPRVHIGSPIADW